MKNTLLSFATARAPRYTSYPTANHFQSDFSEVRHREWLSALNPDTPISIYLHIPFCAKVCWYCACNMKLASRIEPVLAYAQTLKQEIALLADALPARMKVADIHWGGGTPTAMPMEGLRDVLNTLKAHFDMEPGLSHAMELDPRTFRPEWAADLAEMGVNRVSLGVQEFDPKVQDAINRVQPFDVVARGVEALRTAGITEINFDLIYGLPHQTLETLSRSLELTAQLAPNRIALFGYAHVPWMAKNQRLLPEAALPGGAERFEQSEFAANRLQELGYRMIGLDHFAKPDDALCQAADDGTLIRNFQGYAVGPHRSLLGLGATSVSSLPQGYIQNAPEQRSYTRQVERGALPTQKGIAFQGDDMRRRALIESLMCHLEIDLAKFGADFDSELEALRPLHTAGLVELRDQHLRIPPQNRAILRVVASRFDSYLAPSDGQKAHSVAI